jgi:hypothetical protein
MHGRAGSVARGPQRRSGPRPRLRAPGQVAARARTTRLETARLGPTMVAGDIADPDDGRRSSFSTGSDWTGWPIGRRPADRHVWRGIAPRSSAQATPGFRVRCRGSVPGPDRGGRSRADDQGPVGLQTIEASCLCSGARWIPTLERLPSLIVPSWLVGDPAGERNSRPAGVPRVAPQTGRPSEDH